jgi:hypothetical protein
MEKVDEKRSVSELKGKTYGGLNCVLNTSSYRKKINTSELEKDTSFNKKKENQDLLNKSLNANCMVPYVRKKAKLIFNKMFPKKNDTSPLTKSVQDLKKSGGGSKNVIPVQKKVVTSIKGKISEIQKKIKVLNFPLNENSNNRSKLEENSLNSSNIDNLTATTSDKTKNVEDENQKKKEK